MRLLKNTSVKYATTRVNPTEHLHCEIIIYEILNFKESNLNGIFLAEKWEFRMTHVLRTRRIFTEV
jgi:hypothetical protein